MLTQHVLAGLVLAGHGMPDTADISLRIARPPYRWMHLNCLSLDRKRVIIEKEEEQLIA